MKIIESGDKGGMMSEDTRNFYFSKKNPNLYPKLLHPVHGIEKNLITFDWK